MCTRGVWQLSELTLRFCRQGGSSAGTREFLTADPGGLRSFAAANAAVAVSVAHRAGRHPLAVGRYRACMACCRSPR